MINYFKENVTFRLSGKDAISKWIGRVVRKEGKSTGEVNFIFCNDRYLRKLNVEYLHHDYNTDIITFDNSENKNIISGDIYISVDRVKANADSYSATFADELHRVIIHGILHLIGYDDSTEKLKKQMRKKEDEYLLLL
jgi:probable rRNA maturation factor